MSVRHRPEQDGGQGTDISRTKRRKINDAENNEPVITIAPNSSKIDDESERPKSRKELRAEKKALRKAATTIVSQPITVTSTSPDISEEANYRQLKKEKRKVFLEERERLLIKKKREENKLWKQKKMNRLANSKQKQRLKNVDELSHNSSRDNLKTEKHVQLQDYDVSMDVFNKVFKGTTDSKSGMTTLRLGVKYTDLVVGKGKILKDRSSATVKYILTSGKLVTPIDTSSSFTFVFGKGEVVQGWDIGMVGMRVGGRRKLIVPPKAGYGSKDIGGGCGAVLFFDIALLSC